MKCELCGTKTRINWGNAYVILCETCCVSEAGKKLAKTSQSKDKKHTQNINASNYDSTVEGIKYYLTGFVFTGYGDNDKVKIVEIFNSQEKAEEKLVALIKDKQAQGWGIESSPTEEIESTDNNLLRMVVASMSDSINSVTWMITTAPVPMSDGKAMFTDFVDITSEVQQQAVSKGECVAGSEETNITSNMTTSHKVIFACIVATIIGLISLPYGYYVLLKVLFFGSLIYFTAEYLKDKDSTGATLIILFVLIILYNPIFLVELGSKTLWVFVNFATIGFLYWLTGIISNKDA